MLLWALGSPWCCLALGTGFAGPSKPSCEQPWAMTPTSLPRGQAHLGLRSRWVGHGAEGVLLQEGPAKGGMSTPCLRGRAQGTLASP